ncbi:MAG: sel1 repeat family protein [Succinivibrionaceae bacterium]|nr:sel1 repeat family protein [Succinivibrionaceae bacterium]
MRRTIHRFQIHQENVSLTNDTIENTLKLFDLGKYSEALDGCFKFLHTGDIRILLTLVQIYQYGLGTTLSLSEAEKYLVMAASKDAVSCFKLAEWYEHGIRGGEPDHQKAYEYYTRAAQQQYYPAMLKLAKYLNTVTDPQYNPEEAFTIYKSIADDHLETWPEAEYETGMQYLTGTGTDRNPKEGFRYVSMAARHNYLPAIYQLGMMYIKGNGVVPNAETAFKLMNQAAAQNYPLAQYQLGKMYEESIGTFPNGQRAYNWYSFALSLGCEKAASRMASMLLDGTMIPRDYEKAMILVSSGAARGEPECMRVLSRIYGEGLGVKEDQLKSSELIIKAAETGSVKAQRLLGMLYMQGRNQYIPRDVKKSIEWYTRSAENGDRKAQFFLGVYYADETNAPNFLLAQRWLTVLAENGDREAMYCLAKLYVGGKLSPSPDYKKARYYYVEASHLGQIDARFELAKLYHSGVKKEAGDEESVFEKDDQLAYYYAYLIPNEYPNREYPALLKEIEDSITPAEKEDIQQQARMQMLNQVSGKIQRNG